MNDEMQIVKAALEQMPEELGLFDYNSQSDRRVWDGTITLLTPDNRDFLFSTEIKAQPRGEWLEKWKATLDGMGSRHYGLLVCLFLSSEKQKYCIENQLNFIDSAGNAFIKAPGLYVYISGKKSEQKIERPITLSIGIMKLLFVLLANENAINCTYRELAELAGISLGMVSKGFDYLSSKKMYRENNGSRRFTRVNDLYWLWIQEYPIVLRPKLKTMKLTGELNWHNAQLYQDECWAGEVAGHKLSSGYLHPEKFEFFTPHSFTQRWKDLGLRPSQDGNWLLIQSFWGEAFNINQRAFTLLALAELIASDDDRNFETAKMINAKYLHIKKPAF